MAWVSHYGCVLREMKKIKPSMSLREYGHWGWEDSDRLFWVVYMMFQVHLLRVIQIAKLIDQGIHLTAGRLHMCAHGICIKCRTPATLSQCWEGFAGISWYKPFPGQQGRRCSQCMSWGEGTCPGSFIWNLAACFSGSEAHPYYLYWWVWATHKEKIQRSWVLEVNCNFIFW